MKKLLKELQNYWKEMMEFVLVFTKKIVGIYIVLAKIIDSKINAVANYILKKYEIH
jgi:hypothetical protein